MMKKAFLLILALAGALLQAAVTPEQLSTHMEELTPGVRAHLTAALQMIARTPTGKFLFEHISPDVQFRVKAMPQWGSADAQDVITLESLRLEGNSFPETTEHQNRIKVCFTAEILSHEMLHNAQFHAGLFRYPQGCSGYEATLCEKLMELQAKYTGEGMFYELSQLPENKGSVRPKSGFFLVMQRLAADPAKEFLETLWSNRSTTSDGKKLFIRQVREVAQWNAAYTEQAFRNNYGRFLNNVPGVGSAAIAAHLQKIIDFGRTCTSAKFLMEKAPERPISNGIAGYENGSKVLELQAVPGGYVRRTFNGGAVNETLIRVQ